jgi:hypothetical protein
MSEKKYFIQNGYSGNAMLFWARNGGGYSSNIDIAEEFTRAEALSTIRGSWSSHDFKMWDADEVRKHAIRCAHADLVPSSAGHRPKRRPSLKTKTP